MKFIKYILILTFFAGIGIATWVYYPHYQINKMKMELMEVGKDLTKETYIDYYRQSRKQDIYHLALGDSIIHGFGVGEKENLVSKFSNQLADEINKTVHFSNKGKNGMTSTELNKLIQKGLFDKEIAKSDIITINIGGNDILKVARKEDYYQAVQAFDALQSTFTKNLTDITKKIRTVNPKATIVFLELYNALPKKHPLSKAAENLLPKWNVKIYELATTLPSSLVIQTTKVINSENPRNLSPDGVHPSSAGYAAITKQMLEQFLKEFRRQAV